MGIRLTANAQEVVSTGGDLGTYTSTDQVLSEVKIYISGDMVNTFQATGTTVYTEETRHCILGIYIYSTYKYYYYSEQYITKIVTQRELYADMDSAIFVVNQLETFAYQYSSCALNVQDCVLGYIRGINVNYVNNSEASKYAWKLTTGNINKGFINYVDLKDGNQLEIAEFFSAFIPFSSYNYADYGPDDGYNASTTYDDNYCRNLDLKMVDPFNSNSYIDIIHMFASMDGIYNASNQGSYQPDLVSWAGDLQTYAVDLSKNNVNTSLIQNEINSWNIYSNQNIDFCDIAGLSTCSFQEDDLLADIDATNIMQLLVNGVPTIDNGIFVSPNCYNSISTALIGYYTTVNGDNSYYSNRYEIFLTAVNSRNGSIVNEDFSSRLQGKVYDKMYIKVVNGAFANVSTFVGTYTTRLYYTNTANQTVEASLNSRIYSALLFDGYIKYMASRPYYS